MEKAAALEQSVDAAVARQREGKGAAAGAICRRVIVGAPGSPDALHLHGVLLAQIGAAAAAASAIRRALAAGADQALARSNLGNTLAEVGDVGGATVEYRRALASSPSFDGATYNLANVIYRQGSARDAITWLVRVGALTSQNGLAAGNLAGLLREGGHYSRALCVGRRALALVPDNAEAQYNVALVLLDTNDPSALVHARRAKGLRAGWSRGAFAVGRALAGRDQIAASDMWYRRAVALAPSEADSHLNLATLRLLAAEQAAAVTFYGRASACDPRDERGEGNRLFAEMFLPAASVEQTTSANRRWGRRIMAAATAMGEPENDRDPERRLRIGYVSPEFVKHGFLQQIVPVLRSHDRRQVDVFAYADVARPDSWTRRVRELVSGWRSIAGLSLVEQADLVRVDRIDVLVNLTGYLAQYRLLFARRVAPVQVAYINHVAPTGLRTIDARITDDWIEPADGGGGDPDERLVRMASGFSCFDPPSTTRDVGPLPALRTGRVTFGYLNNFAKVSPQALDAWSSILKAVPGSRLVVKSISMSDHVLVSRLLGEFGRRGIAADCVETIGRLADDDANLAAIEGIDIGLDPFPFNGGISTAETLWMGVPVISLAGQGLVARLGLSLLSRADLADLVATTTDEYCRLAVELAQDVGRLAELRGSMRQRLLRSRLFDASAHTRELEGVFRALWARWCGGVLRTSGRPSSQSRQGRVALPGSNR